MSMRIKLLYLEIIHLSHCSPTVNFYVFLDSCFKLQKQVTTIVKTRFYQLHQTTKARSDPPPKDLEKCVNGILQ